MYKKEGGKNGVAAYSWYCADRNRVLQEVNRIEALSRASFFGLAKFTTFLIERY